jgi:hypothetical protein
MWTARVGLHRSVAELPRDLERTPVDRQRVVRPAVLLVGEPQVEERLGQAAPVAVALAHGGDALEVRTHSGPVAGVESLAVAHLGERLERIRLALRIAGVARGGERLLERPARGDGVPAAVGIAVREHAAALGQEARAPRRLGRTGPLELAGEETLRVRPAAGQRVRSRRGNRGVGGIRSAARRRSEARIANDREKSPARNVMKCLLVTA